MALQAQSSGGFLQRVFQPEEYKWWHAALFGVAVNLPPVLVGALPLIRSGGSDEAFYKSMQQAWYAPPAWAFGPVWAFNNITTLWGNLILLNKPAHTPYRTSLLLVQGASWFLFATFGIVYFGMKSVILAFGWTFADLLLTLLSLWLAARIDRRIVLSLVPLTLWLLLASAVAAYQVLYNRDILFDVGPWL
ncbi:MAG: tryptophan-rich sensory protein [Chloroflexaceae bacterium]|nr:tryptophan-rich sensory protein [Chloroflexaceae bacterium]NJO05527.1 tryptophan-rich sensory protein [Chloroflexaceae bacterium]